MTKECIVCKTEISNRRVTCTKRECIRAHRMVMDGKQAARKDAGEHRLCEVCGTNIDRSHRRSVICDAKSCRRKRKAAIERKSRGATLQGKRIRPEKKDPVIVKIPQIKVVPRKVKKDNRCTVSGCISDRGVNRFWCRYHHALMTKVAGRTDGGWGEA